MSPPPPTHKMRSSLLRPRTLFLAIASFILVSTFYGYHHTSTLVSRLPDFAWSRFQKPSAPPPPRDLRAGKWAPSEMRREDAALWGTTDCSVNYSDGKEKHDVPKESAERLSNVSAWTWVPDDGLPVLEWEAERFVERLVQSRVGMIIAGDSISENTWEALHHLISPPLKPGPPLVLRRRFSDRYKAKGYLNETRLYLHNLHPLYTQLKAKYPNIPAERFDQPIVTGIRSDTILTDPEIEKLMRQTGYEKQVRAMWRSQGDWRRKLDEYAVAEGWEGEQVGILLINTGVHWNEYYMSVPNEYLLKAYPLILDILRTKITTISQTLPLRSFFRSMAPGHEKCETFHTPATLGEPITQPIQNTRSWHIFPQYNDIARNAFPYYLDNVNHTAGLQFWDIWNMSVVRPDAHLGWTGTAFDCIHWCSPSVPEWWLRTLWYTFVEQNW
ncbi:hypothetical protein FRB99_004048 [Tulasnella sp. 403]|nr:hypothetical protein FRB99_004048 [Tulasnella sp. 403]